MPISTASGRALVSSFCQRARIASRCSQPELQRDRRETHPVEKWNLHRARAQQALHHRRRRDLPCMEVIVVRCNRCRDKLYSAIITACQFHGRQIYRSHFALKRTASFKQDIAIARIPVHYRYDEPVCDFYETQGPSMIGLSRRIGCNS